ncbi:MAG: AMMECR1 domain-containing protein, partial [Candidatus Krumholzibacteria bacterium]|nr:AMMECR1 domain-containing protein [Candidatus Krumholzibacteria bacterium]
RQGDRSAVFLPQIASEQGWSREEMLAHLCRKAGLPADAWREGAQLLTFQADVFGEPEPH